MTTAAIDASTAPARLHLSENPYGASPSALRAARQALESTARYPDPARLSPARALADHCGVGEDQVVVANGSDELVLLTALALGDRNRPGVTTAGTFPGYRICLEAAGRCCAEISLDGARTDADAVAATMEDAGIVYLCHPHNPTGSALDRADLDLLVERAAVTGTPLVVDEAYLEFAPAAPRDCATTWTAAPRCCRCAPSPRRTAWPRCASATPSAVPGSSPGCARRRARCRSV